MKKVPKRRFKGFLNAGDWEQRKLGELLEQPITDGPHETPELYDSGIPFISVDAIIDNKIDFTKMRGCISKEYDDICAKKYKPQINDVYLVKSGATIGKVAIVDTYDDFNIWSPLAAMRCGSITNPYFLYVLLQTKDLQTQVFNKASHGTQPNLSMRQLETFACKVPKIEEQILISRFFKRLNDSITLHQRKLEKLQATKKALLYELFPIENSRRPKLRFKGFTGDWEQRKLISCIQKVIDFRGRTPNKLGMEWSCSGHLALSALNVKDGYIDFSQDNHYGDNDLYEKWMTGNELHKGQVVFTTEAPMGNVAQIPDNERYILSQRTVAFCVDENIITENFLAVLLRTPVVFKTLTKLSSGGTAQGISQKSLAEIEVRIPPNLHEQQIISNFLLSFEHCITLHQRKLEKLKNLKAAYLNEMFV